MSTNLPMRTVRNPIFRRQCLFLHSYHHHRTFPERPSQSKCTSRAFSTTPTYRRGGSSLGQDAAMIRFQARQNRGPAPQVGMAMAQRDASAQAEDIGILQDTIIRAPLSELPQPWKPAFWSYHWKLLKSKGTGVFSRSMYHRMYNPRGSWIGRTLPIDFLNDRQLKTLAGKIYTQVCEAFAKGDVAIIRRFCLPPLARKFEHRINARTVRMQWTLQSIRSVAVMTHRASLMGEDQPNTGYRQAVVRIVSTQSLSLSEDPKKTIGLKQVAGASSTKAVGRRGADGFYDNGKSKHVVEYLVLQKRMVDGKEDENWRLQGFTQASTPSSIEEDEEYFRKTMEAQAVM